MAQDSTRLEQQPTTSKPLSATDIAAYLKRHPGFLAEQLVNDADLVTALAPHLISLDDDYISMPHFIAERMRREVLRLRQGFHQYQQKIHSDQHQQDRLYQLIHKILHVQDFNAFLDIITWDIAPNLDIDTVILCVESDRPQFIFSEEDLIQAIQTGRFYRAEETEITQPGVKIVPNGATHLLIDRSERSRHSIQGSQFALFPGLGAHMHCEFLVKLDVTPQSQPAFLAFGARKPQAFTSVTTQSRLAFLSQCLELSLNRLLTETDETGPVDH